MAHNEGATIEACLRSILAQDAVDDDVVVSSVVVVASGCVDSTVDVVRSVMADDDRVRLLIEGQRSGKAAAINWFLRETDEPICALVSGDVILAHGALVHLVRPMMDPKVGMTGGRPVPTNRRAGVVGNAVHVLWDMHHQVALQHPKMGEAVAFRRLFERIDIASTVDEASIEASVIQAGGQLRYVPAAVIRNHGPETLSEYLRQRRRIHLGHLRISRSTDHRPSTMGGGPVLRVALRTAARRPQSAHHVAATVILEAIARIQATAKFKLSTDRRPGTWVPIVSSKQVVRTGHTLRAYHEASVTLTLFPQDSAVPQTWKERRWLRNHLRLLLRDEDHVRIDSASMRLRLQTDPDRVPLIITRLEAELPGWHVLPSAVVPLCRHHRAARLRKMHAVPPDPYPTQLPRVSAGASLQRDTSPREPKQYPKNSGS